MPVKKNDTDHLTVSHRGIVFIRIQYKDEDDRAAILSQAHAWGTAHGPTRTGDKYVDIATAKHLDDDSVYEDIVRWVQEYNDAKRVPDPVPAPRPRTRIALSVSEAQAKDSPARLFAVYTVDDAATAWFFDNAPKYGRVEDRRNKEFVIYNPGAIAYFYPSPNYEREAVIRYLESVGGAA